MVKKARDLKRGDVIYDVLRKEIWIVRTSHFLLLPSRSDGMVIGHKPVTGCGRLLDCGESQSIPVIGQSTEVF